MHKTAEYGIAAHWKYKEASDGKKISTGEEEKLAWLHQILEWQNDTSDNKEFMKLIKIYCTTRIHAPNNPNELLMIHAEDEETKWPNPNQAFEKVRDLIRTWGWIYGKEDIYEAIKDNPALTKTVKEMESDLRQLTTEDTFTPERFRKAYAINLKAMCMRNRDEKLRLAVASGQQAIESGSLGRALPYET